MPPRPLPGRLLLCACLAAAWLDRPAQAAHHPGRRWVVLETAHFRVHHYQGLEGTAARVAEAAEAAYPRLLRAFGAAEGPPIPVILDHDAFFNGEAEPLKDRITLDPALASSSVVGTDRFVAHELAHVMTFRALRAAHPLARLNGLGALPTWFLEGIAQLEAEAWSPALDRMLRLSSLEGNLLTPSERTHFRQLGVHAGAAGYTEGYALCRELLGGPGSPRLARLFGLLRGGRHSFEQAIAATCGAPLGTLEARWRANLAARYGRQVQGLPARPPEARVLVGSVGGEVHLRPRFSPDGGRLAFLTSRGQDSFLYLRGQLLGLLSLAVARPDGSDVRVLAAGAGGVGAFDWSPDGREIAFTAAGRDPTGSPCFDVFVHHLESGRTTRLTQGAQALALAWTPGGAELACISLRDGHNALVMVDRRTRATRTFRTLPGTEQWRDLAFDRAGRRLAGVAFEPGEGGRVFWMDWATQRLTRATLPPLRGGDAGPCWSPDGTSLIFSSDRDGLANLVSLDLETRASRPFTRAWGGLETPAMAPDGTALLCTAFKARGAELIRMPFPGASRAAGGSVPRPQPVTPGSEPPRPEPLDGPPGSALGAHAGRPWPPLGPLPRWQPPSPPGAGKAHAPGVPYRSELTMDLLVPQVTVDERGQQLGVASIYSDILRQQELALDVRWGILSQRFAYTATYANRMGPVSWLARAFDAPQLGLSPALGRSGVTLQQSLYLQRLQGVSLGAQLPLGAGRSLQASAQAAHLGTLTPPLAGDPTALREGALHTLGAVFTEQRLRPTVDQDLNPSDGYRLALGWTLSDRALGSAFDFNHWTVQGERYFPIVPAWRHHLTWHWSAGAILGTAPQPLLLGGPNPSSQIFALRGHAVGALTGNRLATTGLTYTAPLATHLDRLLGPVYLDRLYVAAFAEAGTTFGDPTAPSRLGSAGLELRLRTTVGGRQALTPRLGLAQPLGAPFGPGVYLAF